MTGTDLQLVARARHMVLELPEELDLISADETEAAVRDAAAAGTCVIADLAAVKFIDCYALRALLRARTAARQAGGDVLLAAPPRHVLRLLALTGLDGVFATYGSVTAARRQYDHSLSGSWTGEELT